MRASFVVILMVVLMVCTADAWWGGGRKGSSQSRSSSRTSVVKKGPFLSVRPRDKTGHRTGLGTIAKSFVRQPIKTVKSVGAFIKNYNDMKKKNIKGGNLDAHRKANYEATKIGGSELAKGISAAREQYKRFRVKTNPDGTTHIGDTRTPQEIKNTMDANKKGRENAMG